MKISDKRTALIEENNIVSDVNYFPNETIDIENIRNSECMTNR
jgi:hypothetical protein